MLLENCTWTKVVKNFLPFLSHCGMTPNLIPIRPVLLVLKFQGKQGRLIIVEAAQPSILQ